MADVRDVVAYICTNYPYPWHLSKARLTKLIYLADWRSMLKRGRTITSTVWEFNYYGPYVESVVNSVRDDSAFKIIRTLNAYGDLKELVVLKAAVTWPTLTKEDQDIIAFVIDNTQDLTWTKFIELVYATYPVRNTPRHSTLNLQILAREFNAAAAGGFEVA